MVLGVHPNDIDFDVLNAREVDFNSPIDPPYVEVELGFSGYATLRLSD